MEMKTTEINELKTQVVFKMADEDTCLKTWTFELMNNDGPTIIMDSSIEYTKQGCNGHPKTISALIKGRRINDIDTEALMETTCFRNQSCGMTLAKCIEAMR